MKNIKDQIRGCLVGGAAGDALGYAVEFKREREIFDTFGKNGITEYKLNSRTGKAMISDDTQMTLFTATGMLARSVKGMLRDIEESYFDWLTTQNFTFEESQRIMVHNSWLRKVPELYALRAPGNTCLSALSTRIRGKEAPESYIKTPLNNSKGCGGVMRTAPIGFIRGDIEQTDMLAAEASAITHSNPLGYMPSAVTAHIINRILYGDPEMSLKEIVVEARNTAEKLFEDTKDIQILTDIIDLAIELSSNSEPDLENIHRLGEGWVAEETLGIALYCALRYENDFSAAITAAVNHKGDSDSTGAVTGNILGALIGYDAIDDKWKTDLELLDVILKTADDLDAEYNK